MNNERIKKMELLINEKLMPTALEVIDDSHHHVGHVGAKGGAGHFTVKICSKAFENKSLVERHKMVYNALDSMMHREIHALSIEALTLLEKENK